MQITHHRYITAILFTTIVLLWACKKPLKESAVQTPPVTIQEAINCYHNKVWDSTAIVQALYGKWHWEFISCYWKPEEANALQFKGLTVRFFDNHTVELTLNEMLVQSSQWTLQNTNDGYFTLNTEPLVLQLPGKLLFCNNRLICYDSYTDGCDNYFVSGP